MTTPPQKKPSTMRLHLWIETEDGVLFGLGRMLLLKEIELCGSLKGAAEKLGMSYRGAWGKLRSTEKALGEAVIIKDGCRRSGYTLTPFGHELISRFDTWFQEVEDFALKTSKEYLPFSLSKFMDDV